VELFTEDPDSSSSQRDVEAQKGPRFLVRWLVLPEVFGWGLEAFPGLSPKGLAHNPHDFCCRWLGGPDSADGPRRSHVVRYPPGLSDRACSRWILKGCCTTQPTAATLALKQPVTLNVGMGDTITFDLR